MQRDAILALEGRELDAKVAEVVFGWKQLSSGVWDTPEEYRLELPAYSSTWEGMGLIVGEMERRGYLIFGLDSGAALDGLPNWFAGFHREAGPGTVYAETAQLAVARAALLALREEE